MAGLTVSVVFPTALQVTAMVAPRCAEEPHSVCSRNGTLQRIVAPVVRSQRRRSWPALPAPDLPARAVRW